MKVPLKKKLRLDRVKLSDGRKTDKSIAIDDLWIMADNVHLDVAIGRWWWDDPAMRRVCTSLEPAWHRGKRVWIREVYRPGPGHHSGTWTETIISLERGVNLLMDLGAYPFPDPPKQTTTP